MTLVILLAYVSPNWAFNLTWTKLVPPSGLADFSERGLEVGG